MPVSALAFSSFASQTVLPADQTMHFDFLPKSTHNEDAIRELEHEESLRIKRWLKWLAIVMPIILVLAWLFLHYVR